MGSVRSQISPLNMEVFQSLLDSYEAKKKYALPPLGQASVPDLISRHYMPATTKVLSIIDKGVQDRVTKNGECLRRHADSTQRWKLIRERITRTDIEMEAVRRTLTGEEEITPSDSGSVVSGPTSKSKSRNGYLTPPSASSSKKSLTLSASSALSRSVSPFRRFARKLTGSGKSQNAAATPRQQSKSQRAPSSAPPTGTLRHRSSLFNITSAQPSMPTTPERLGHKYSQSLTPESTPSSRIPDQDVNITIKGKTVTPSKQPWNSSTRVDENHRSRRPSVVTPHRPEAVPHPPPVPHQRSVSRSSMASSRPWSPVMSSVSTSGSTNPTHPQRSPSRARTPGVMSTSPRARPTTPSHIPGPSRSHFLNFSDTAWDDSEPTTSLMQRALSPDHSPPRATTPGGTRLPGPRPPSRSMIPAPVFNILSPSRPGSTLSNYRDHNINNGGSPTHSHTSFRSAALRAQTPESTVRLRAQAVPFYGSISAGSGSAGSSVNNSPRVLRPSVGAKLPPSSFREASTSSLMTLGQRTPSRPSSRLSDFNNGANPTFVYTPGNPRDPLDAEVAAIVNSIAHGLLIERVDPPLRTIPREGEEIRAQYAFSNSLAKKTVTCRLTTLSRAGAKGESSTATKKVMVRVGGGKQVIETCCTSPSWTDGLFYFIFW
jgi:hypothetical protein